MCVGAESLAEESIDPLRPVRMDAGSHIWSTTLLLTLEALSVALCAWQLRASDALYTLVRSNDLGPGPVRWGGPSSSAYLGAAMGLSVALLVFAWGRKYADLLHTLARRAAPLALAALLPPLFQWRIWVDRDLVHLLYVLTVVLLTKNLVFYSLSAPTLVSDDPEASAMVERCRCVGDGLDTMVRAMPQRLAV
jgi:hypothetical protein